MSQASILYPAFAHVLLTNVVLFVMLARRARAMREKRLRFEDVALGQSVWNEAATKAGRNYNNQFEMPVLFHAACAMALAAKAVDATLLGLAWAFVAARIVHSLIHLGPNSVPMRAVVFGLSALLTLAMWGVLVWRAAN